jgi:murein DD-endopeptidase MepM/ murein hydrolase activator NlpD
MRLSSDDSEQPSQDQWEAVSDTPTAPLIAYKNPPTTDQLPNNVPPTTGHLPENTARITRKLVVQNGKTPPTRLLLIEQPRTTRPLLDERSTRPLTLIPATEKRQQRIPLTQRQRTIKVLFLCLIVVLVPVLFVTPLGIGQHQDVTSTIQQILAQGPFGSFNPTQHPITPTATPALLTNEGSCNQPSMGLWGTCATAVTESGVMGTQTMQRPLIESTITQVFANPEYQSWCSCVRPHTGIDLAAPDGTPITAADDGQVIWTGWDWSGLGWAVKINHGRYIATVYGHLSRFIVKVGQNVTRGEVIAYEGSTGASTGPHLHFMVVVNNYWVNPATYITLP